MSQNHPVVEITGGDLYLHDIYLYDEAGALLDVSGHTFTAKVRTKIEGEEIVLTSGVTAATTGPGCVRFTIPAAGTTQLADTHDSCVYAVRDTTTQSTILVVPATVVAGVAA